MKEKNLKAYFKQQVRALMERGAGEPDGFRAYFAHRQVKDDEILGLLAVSAMMSGELPGAFPTPLEALAALPPASRAEICREFRKLLKASLRQQTAA